MNSFFDEFKDKAKTMYGVASKATSEAMEIGKLHYQIKQTRWDMEKTYARLGSYVYDARKGEQGLDDAINLAIAEVDALGEKLEELEQRLRARKKVGQCANCNKENDVDARYCCHCGEGIEQPPIEAEVYESHEGDDHHHH